MKTVKLDPPTDSNPDRINQLRACLESHFVETAIVGSSLMAWESMMHFDADGNRTDESFWVNVTNWTNREIRLWLGY